MVFTLIRDGTGDADRSALSAHCSEGEMCKRGLGALSELWSFPAFRSLSVQCSQWVLLNSYSRTNSSVSYRSGFHQDVSEQ